MTDRAAVEAGAEEVRSRLGRPTILVNSAGIAPEGPFLEISTEQWNRSIAVNLTGTFDCCQVVLPGMLEAGWGQTFNVNGGRNT